MPIDVHFVTEKRFGAIYDGTNSADFNTAISNFTIVSEVGGVLTFDSDNPGYVANTGDWIIWLQGAVANVFSPSQFATFLTTVPTDERVDDLATDLTTLEAVVDALGDAAMLSVGAAAVPTLLASAQVTVSVTLYPTLPDTSYTPHTQLFGGINLGPLEILSTTVVSTTVVDVVVRNNGLLSLTGATLLVSAVG